MRISFLIICCIIWISACTNRVYQSEKITTANKAYKSHIYKSQSPWKLIFSDEFNSKRNFDTKKWIYCDRRSAAWSKYLTSSPKYVFQSQGKLILKMDDAVISGDDVPYHSGGIQTSTKFSMLYGKVEVRAKFKTGRGSWPAIWMMPETPASYGGWPKSGEIDIMEHVNNENMVHQTIHNEAVTNSNGGSTATKSSSYNETDYNNYSIIWSPKSIEFYVNDILQYTYTKAENATSRDWPFDKPFYLILNQAGGAGWPGPITNVDLPFEMKVDWVRIYQL